MIKDKILKDLQKAVEGLGYKSTEESVVRLMEAAGYEVVRANYEGDVGMHIAKAIYALLHLDSFNEEVKKIEGVWARVELLGKAYAAGSKAFEEDEEAQKAIKDINFLVYASAQRFAAEKGAEPSSTDYLKFVTGRKGEIDEVFNLWKETRQWSLDYFETIYKRVYTHYDRYYFESECLAGVDIAREVVKEGILEESEGAVIFKGEKYGLDTRVFVNSLGLPTYEAKELGLAEAKQEKGQFDISLTITAHEISEYFKVVRKAAELVFPDLAGRMLARFHGFLRLTTGKMSSRKGNVITGESLLRDLTEEARGRQDVAVGAIKYVLLKSGVAKDIIFDPEQSLSLEGDSGPYLQYALVRTRALLRKAKEAGVKTWSSDDQVLDMPAEASVLERVLVHSSGVVERAAKELEPHYLTPYLTELASAFNSWYASGKVIGGPHQNYGVFLTTAVERTLSQGLGLLGIPTPEEM